MTMNSKLLVSLILGVMPLAMLAQDDDMYFVPTKKAAKSTSATVRVSRPAPTYYSGSNRDVDEYNRRGGSSYEVLPADTTGNDIISFDGERGVYPDSVGTEDFALTRQMSRYDGYEPDEAYMAGYNDGQRDSWGWHSPWYYSYYPWYDSYWYWNDPWYYRHYSWYYGGWYDPWYYNYGYYGWFRPYYYGYAPHYYVSVGSVNRTYRNNRLVSTTRRGISDGRTTRFSNGTFGGSSLANRQTATRNRTTTPVTTQRQTPVYSNSHGNFGGNRTMSTPTNSSSNRSVGSFGGSGMTRSAGPSGGGGGSFGGVSTRGGSRSSRR